MPVLNYTYQAQFSPDTYRPVQDTTGALPANNVSGERQVLTAANGTDQQFIVPLFAPFFGGVGDLSIVYQPFSGSARTLAEGIDYTLAFQFIGASRACAKPIYGGISFLNNQLAGTLTLDYHTLGGTWTINQNEINRILADAITNTRVTAWEQVIDRPLLFPVVDHPWNLTDLVGAKEVVQGIQDLGVAIAARPSAVSPVGLEAHLADLANPHHTDKTQVGLGNVQNYPVATPEQVLAGQATNAYMTPALVALAVNNLVPTIASASDTVNGTVQLNLGNNANDPTNAVDALTAAGLNTLLRGTAPPNAVQTSLKEALKLSVPISALASNSIVLTTDGIYSGSVATAGMYNIYIDATAGDDNNPGTRLLPMRTIAKAVNTGPSGIDRNLLLKEGQNHFVAAGFGIATAFRGGSWQITPYGPSMDAIGSANTAAAQALNTYIVAGTWGVNSTDQAGVALYPINGATIKTIGVNFRCGSPLNNVITFSGDDGSFNEASSNGRWVLNYAKVELPDPSSRFISGIQEAPIAVTIYNTTISGPGKFAIPMSKSFVFNFFPGAGSTEATVKNYLGQPPSANLVYTNFTTNITPTSQAKTALPVPIGGIIMYSGSIASIPVGWVFCDGSNGTPDLRDKFIMGQGNYSVGDEGGFRDATLLFHNHYAYTGNENQGHNHSFGAWTGDENQGHTHNSNYDGRTPSGIDYSGSGSEIGGMGYGYTFPTSTETNTHQHYVNGDTSYESNPHNHAVTVEGSGENGFRKNLPPYYVLAFIKCVGIP
jgi:hypothetical protein